MEAGAAKKRIYFEGLNEVRALAALGVLFHHVELFKNILNMPSLCQSNVYGKYVGHLLGHLGKNGVYVFFVLSGFLITYLLLAEKEKLGKIDFKKFYVRRILRIWPLYYMTVFISFVIIPLLALNIEAFEYSTHYYDRVVRMVNDPYLSLFLYLFFMPNVALKIKQTVAGCSQAWSVGVEEQFYLIWPQLIQRINTKYLMILFVGVVLLPYSYIPARFISADLSKGISAFFSIFPIQIMAMGAVGAYLYYYYKEKIMLLLRSRILFALNTLIFITLLFIPMSNTVFNAVVLLELLLVMQPHFRFNLRNKYLSRIGVLSYGVYMYHPFVMYLMFSLWFAVFGKDNLPTTWLYNTLLYVSIILVTLLLSHFSYEYFEKRFIALKNKKYTVLKSGEKVE